MNMPHSAMAKADAIKPQDFRVSALRGDQDMGMVYSFNGHSAAPEGITSRLIDMMCAVRNERLEQFPGALGSDSCWDVLLHLYSVHLKQHRLNISSLRKRTGIADTTLLRTIATLADAGLVARMPDPFDGRRVMVELSPAGIAAMNRYFARTGTRVVLI
jgi:DNA-binding MarR family transcriptional regulator